MKKLSTVTPKVQQFTVTTREMRLVQNFRFMDDEQQSAFLDVFKVMATKNLLKKAVARERAGPGLRLVVGGRA